MSNDERIVRHTLDNVPGGKTDWQRVKKLTHKDIEAAVRDDPDAAPICDEAWFEQAELVIPAHLKHRWVQIDEDLMAWFRQQGEGSPAEINAALRDHVERRRKGRKKAG